jgi:hypothetical protein
VEASIELECVASVELLHAVHRLRRARA